MVAAIVETLNSNSRLGILVFVASPGQQLNKSESSNFAASGDLPIKSVFVNIVYSAILNSQVGYRCTPVPRLPFPVTSFSNIHHFHIPTQINDQLDPSWKEKRQTKRRCWRTKRHLWHFIIFKVSQPPKRQRFNNSFFLVSSTKAVLSSITLLSWLRI